MTPSAQPSVSSQRSTGWLIVAACFIMLFFNSGARLSYGVVLKPLSSDFAWSRSVLSAVFFINMAVFALSLTVVGRLYDRYGPRWVLIISTIFLTAGYLLTSRMTSLWQFIVCYGVLTAVGLGGTSVPLIATLVSKWFETRRGLAISLALSGNSLGQFILVPLYTTFILHYGWRSAYLIIGCIMFVVNIALALWVIREAPVDGSQQPLGHRQSYTPSDSQNPPLSSRPIRDMGLPEAMRTAAFWLFLLAMFICGGGDFLVVTHLIPLVTDYGISPTIAGNMLAWYGLMSLAGLLVVGPISDILGNKLPIVLTFALRCVLFLVILRYQNLTAFYLFALAFGFTHLMTAPLTPTLMGKLYGFSHVGLLAGVVTTVHHLGGGLWTYLGGVIFDRTGSYESMFILSTVMVFIALGCSLLLVEKRQGNP